MAITNSYNQANIEKEMRLACSRIAPYWSLEHFVAVNPFLGHIDRPFDDVASDLRKISNIQTTFDARFYLDKMANGEIYHEDILDILDDKGVNLEINELIEALKQEIKSERVSAAYPLASDVISEQSEQDWVRFLTTRISLWAASYFDKKQASWRSPFADLPMFKAWKKEGGIDRSYELSGLKNFRKFVQELPQDSKTAAVKSLEKMGIEESEFSSYFIRLLYQIGGWAAFVAKMDWDEKLAGKDGENLMDFLSIMVCFEACMMESFQDQNVKDKWRKSRKLFHNRLGNSSKGILSKLIMQEAYERSCQRKLMNKISGGQNPSESDMNANVQAVFCIDVRSEVIRRKLEETNPYIETLGFAGFFGMPIEYQPIGHESGQNQCPVLLKPGLQVQESHEDLHQIAEKRTWKQQLKQLKNSFKSGAITCFSFVSPLGLTFLPKIISDSFGWTRPVPNPIHTGLDEKHLHFKSAPDISSIDLLTRIQLAKNALKGMSLTENFAPIVLLMGHGSTSVNNPHATGLDCGACGGHAGEINARVAAAILNQAEVRMALEEHGIVIPAETIFMAGLHDTTTDEIQLSNEREIPLDRIEELIRLKESMERAAYLARIERARRMQISTVAQIHSSIERKSNDWSEIRPEWGLAGCSAFVIANRKRTKTVDLEGKSFLHSYDWEKDSEFAVLEQIMTAPMIVTSWINLQYFASTVDQEHFGAGNKTLHNITAGVGVFEGHSGDLRIGLPLQSIHDGEKFQHEPLRLNVIIEAPTDAINKVIEKHEMVRNLVDNQWIHLLAMDESGTVTKRYGGKMKWESLAAETVKKVEPELEHVQ